MDKFRKALLGAASLIALTATGQKSADAAISPSDPNGTGDQHTASNFPAYADPLFEFMTRTNGTFDRQAIESALREMFTDPSPAQINLLPTLLLNLHELGASPNIIALSRELMVELVSKSSKITHTEMETALDELELAQPGVFKLAAADDDKRRRRRRRDPEEVGQVGGAPAAAS